MSGINRFDPIDPANFVNPAPLNSEPSHHVAAMPPIADMKAGKNPLDNSKLGLGFLLLDHPELTKQIHDVLNNPER